MYQGVAAFYLRVWCKSQDLITSISILSISLGLICALLQRRYARGEYLLKRVKEICPDTYPLFSSEGPVIGLHIEPGTVGVAWYSLPLELDKLVND